MLWLHKHDAQSEQLDLLEKAVDEQLGSTKLDFKNTADDGDRDEEEKYVKLLREVLVNARVAESDSP